MATEEFLWGKKRNGLLSEPLTSGRFRHVLNAALWVFSMAAPLLLASAQELPAGHLVVEGSDCAMMGDFASSQSQTVRFRLRNAGAAPVLATR